MEKIEILYLSLEHRLDKHLNIPSGKKYLLNDRL